MSRVSTPRRYPSGELSKFDSPSNSTTVSSPWGPLAVQSLPAVRKSSYAHIRKISREQLKDEDVAHLTELLSNKSLQKRASEQSLRKRRRRNLRPFNSKLDLLDNKHLTSFNSNLDPPDTDSIYIVEDYIPISEDTTSNISNNTTTNFTNTTTTIANSLPGISFQNIHHCIACHKSILVDLIFEKQYKNGLKIVCLHCINNPSTKQHINASRIIKIEPQALPGAFGSFSSTTTNSSEKESNNTYFILENQPDWYERLQRRLRWRWRVGGLIK